MSKDETTRYAWIGEQFVQMKHQGKGIEGGGGGMHVKGAWGNSRQGDCRLNARKFVWVNLPVTYLIP